MTGLISITDQTAITDTRQDRGQKIADCWDRFLRGKTPQTRRAYSNDLKEFYLFLQRAAANEINGAEGAQIKDLAARFLNDSGKVSEMAEEFIISQREKRHSERTINRRLATLKSFFAYLTQAGIYRDNPLQFLKTKKPDDLKGEAITYGDLEKLQAVFNDDTLQHLRNRLLINVLFYGCMRRIEAARIRIEDIQQETREGMNFLVIRIIGKGNHEQSKELPASVSGQLLNYLTRSGRSLDSTGYLFTSCSNRNSGNPGLTGDAIYSMLTYALKAAKLRGKSPHSLRRGSITEALRANLPLSEIQRMSGHKTISMILHYQRGIIPSAAHKLNGPV